MIKQELIFLPASPVIRTTTMETEYGFEKLQGDNYVIWSWNMTLQLKKENLWTIVSGEESAPQVPDTFSEKETVDAKRYISEYNR